MADNPNTHGVITDAVLSTITTSTPTSSLLTDKTTAPNSKKASPHTFSSGAMAGVGIGCAIAAGLLVGLAWFTASRSRKRRAVRKTRGPPIPSPSHRRSRTPKAEYDLRDLPQEAAHDELRRDFSRLETAVKNWALEYFNNEPLRLGVIDDDAALALLGTKTPDNTAAKWLQGIKRSRNASMFVRAYVAGVLLRRIDINGTWNIHDNLLPGYLVRCFQNILPETSQRGDLRCKSNLRFFPRLPMVTYRRIILSYLLQHFSGPRSPRT